MIAPQQQQLRRRLENAIVEDAKAKAIDAAKKAAVRQRVDVETFQALVSAAHLRPMRGGLRIAAGQGGKPAAAPRNFRPDGTIAAPTSSSAAPCNSTTNRSVLDDALRSGSHFMRAWRAAPAPADHLQLLQRAHEAGALPRLLKLELSKRLLEDILACMMLPAADAGEQLHAAHQAGNASGALNSLVAAVLEAAAGATAFVVARAGLSLQGRQHLTTLLGTLGSSNVASSALLQAYMAS